MSFLQAFGGGGFYSHYLPAIKKVGRSGTQPEKVECLRPVECLSDFHLLAWMILVYMNIACLLISLVVLHTGSFFFSVCIEGFLWSLPCLPVESCSFSLATLDHVYVPICRQHPSCSRFGVTFREDQGCKHPLHLQLGFIINLSKFALFHLR